MIQELQLCLQISRCCFVGLFLCCWSEITLMYLCEKYRRERVGKSLLSLPLPKIPVHHVHNDLQTNLTEEVRRDMMNTGSAMSVTHCQQQPFYPHRHFHFVMCSAVNAFLPSPLNKVCVDSGRADTWERDPKAPGARRRICL